MTDPIKKAEPWLALCANCDIGLPTDCTCPRGDYRAVMLLLVEEIERLRNEKNHEARHR